MTRHELASIRDLQTEVSLWRYKATQEHDSDILKAIDLLLNNAEKTLERLNEELTEITDEELRKIFVYRFVRSMSWRQVANRLGYGSEDSVRVRCVRAFDSDGKLKNKYIC